MTIQLSFCTAADMWSIFRSLTGLPLVKVNTNVAIDPLHILIFTGSGKNLILCGLKKPLTEPLRFVLPMEAGASPIDGTPEENLARLKKEEQEAKNKPTLVARPSNLAA
ncbi:MAG: hypothetical protein HY918_03995 [Candidatus Doudnabacteria bacterium]|nr:hypothetical protein [Candidatus Doudnabacteria bacterium]